MLRKSDGLHELGGLQLHSSLSLLVAWLLVSLCLVRGVKSLGKVGTLQTAELETDLWRDGFFFFVCVDIFFSRSQFTPSFRSAR